MNRGDADDQLAPDAPLLQSDHSAIVETHNDTDNRQSDLDRERSGSLFIWALTFSAGISGLLFGYE